MTKQNASKSQANGKAKRKRDSSKRPAFMFYVGDWMKDAALRSCSVAARGVYIDMLCLMHESEMRGVLRTAGKPWPVEKIANAINGATLDMIAELIDSRVVRVSTRTSTVFSARMVRDELTSRRRSRVGSIGGRNGNRSQAKPKQSSSKHPSKSEANTQAKPKQSPEYENEDESEDHTPDSSFPSEQRKSHPAYAKCSESQARAIYDQYPRRVGKAEAVKAIVKAVAAIAGDEAHLGHDDPLTWLQRRVVTYAGSPRGQPPPKGEADYRPHPATWFNQARYDDDDGEWQQPNGNGPTGPAAPKPGRDDWRERKAAREYTHDEPPPRNL